MRVGVRVGVRGRVVKRGVKLRVEVRPRVRKWLVRKAMAGAKTKIRALMKKRKRWGKKKMGKDGGRKSAKKRVTRVLSATTRKKVIKEE